MGINSSEDTIQDNAEDLFADIQPPADSGAPSDDVFTSVLCDILSFRFVCTQQCEYFMQLTLTQ